MDRDDPAYSGQSDYTRLLLNGYDPLVLGPIATFVWRCRTARLVERYRRHIRLRHLDTTAVEADVCKPLPVDGPFDSAALHLVIHCLPGPLARCWANASGQSGSSGDGCVPMRLSGRVNPTNEPRRAVQ